MTNGPPHSSHSGPPDGAGADSARGGARPPSGTNSSELPTIAKAWWHAAQVPVRTWAARTSKATSAPQSGHASGMDVAVERTTRAD